MRVRETVNRGSQEGDDPSFLSGFRTFTIIPEMPTASESLAFKGRAKSSRVGKSSTAHGAEIFARIPHGCPWSDETCAARSCPARATRG